jgi:uracil-DNA glycosylase
MIPFERVMGQEWANLLAPLSLEYKERLSKFLINEYSYKAIYPNKEDVFKCFTACPLETTKVIILGQDPYPNTIMVQRKTYPVATGVAFANRKFDPIWTELSPSLKKIEEAVKRYEEPINPVFVFDKSLIRWAEQGVLLLNSALTVQANTPGSHSKPWKAFIGCIIQELSKKGNYIFCLWGNTAIGFKEIIGKNNTVLTCTHPAYAVHKNIPWECTHFEEINDILVKTNQKRIYW